MHRLRRAILAGALAVGMVGATACSGGTARRVEKGSLPPTSTDGTAATSSALEWSPCSGAECATVRVPLDAAAPAKGDIDLTIARHRATGDRIGVLLANPGGPGASGLWLAQQAADIFPDTILEHFDVVAWDPRGVGRSTPINCTSNLDWFWRVDRSPDTPREVRQNVAAAQRLANECAKNGARVLPYLSSRQTVADMDAIRRALGATQISYLGFSYGTYLGTLYADRFPTRVRAMVLDGAVDPALSPDAAAEQQAKGFDTALDAFLTDCSRDTSCDFHAGGDSASAYTRVMAAIDAEPLFAEVAGEQRTLGPGEADVGVAEALYGGRPQWPSLAAALASAARGDGSRLLELSDEYTERKRGGTYSNQTEAFYATGCLDSPAPATVAAVERDAAAAAKVAPHFGESTVWLGLPCTYWKAKPDGVVGPVHAKGAPPIVVLGTTRDPATPFAWARSLASELDTGHLVSLDDVRHTAYLSGSECINKAVDDYLVDLTVPEDGLAC